MSSRFIFISLHPSFYLYNVATYIVYHIFWILQAFLSIFIGICRSKFMENLPEWSYPFKEGHKVLKIKNYVSEEGRITFHVR